MIGSKLFWDETHVAWRVARRAPMAARRIFTVIALLVLGAGPASAQLKAPGEVRWFVDATTNVIVNSTSFASVPIPPGHTAVLKSVVDAACSCESRGRGLMGRHDVHLAAVRTGADHRRGPAQGGGAACCTNG